MYLDNKFLFR